MSITLLYGCAHIELAVWDLQQAVAFMHDALGAERVEEQLAKEITDLTPGGAFLVEHLGCGDAVFQLCQPARKPGVPARVSIHETYLESVGPCVTNLNYYVDDATHAHELLTRMGAETLRAGPTSAVPSLSDYGPDNTRPGEASSFYFMRARDLIGFDLELEEPNFKRFSEQSVQYPCFVHPRPAIAQGGVRLLRQRVVVRDLEETFRNLVQLVAPASRSGAHDVREGSQAKAFRITVGGLEVEYCQPLARTGKLREQLSRFGPGVVALVFGVEDPGSVLEATSVPFQEEADLLGLAASRDLRRFEIGSRARIGFDVVLEPLRAVL